MFKELGYIEGMLLFTYFRIPLDEGLLPLMSEEDVIRFLEYVPRFREVEVYIETDVSFVEKHLMERMTSKGKAMLIEEIVDHDVNDPIGNELDADSRNNVPTTKVYRKMLEDRTRRRSDEFKFRKLLAEIDHEFGLDNSTQDEQDVSNDVDFDDVVFDDVSFDDVDFDDVSFDDVDLDVVDFDVGMIDLDFEQELEEVLHYATYDSIDVEWKDDPYHNVDEPKEISDMFADLDQALDELDQVTEAQDVSDLFVVYDQLIDDDGAFGKLLEEKHVTWARFGWRRCQKFLLTLSGSYGDGVTIADLKKPLEDSTG
ncbi:hypothetical protein Tco_0453053 [Tanacetum coccineum]